MINKEYALEYKDETIQMLQAEITRLRGAYEQERKDCINLTEKVIPNLRAEIERFKQMVKDAAQALNDEERENERLRGLLREWLYTDGQELTGTYEAWERRVRKALGDQ